MDKALISRRFAKAVGTYLDKADVQRYVASRMAELTGRYIPSDIQERVLEIGCGTGMFTRMYLQQAVPEEMWLNDLCPEVEPYLADVLGEKVHFMAKDAETLAFPEGQDLIVSCSAVQWFEDLPRFFSGCRKLLHEGGYLAFSTFGPHNTEEVATLTAAGLSYPSLEELKEMLTARYEVVYATRNSCACHSLLLGSVEAFEGNWSDRHGCTAMDTRQVAGVLPELYETVFG